MSEEKAFAVGQVHPLSGTGGSQLDSWLGGLIAASDNLEKPSHIADGGPASSPKSEYGQASAVTVRTCDVSICGAVLHHEHRYMGAAGGVGGLAIVNSTCLHANAHMYCVLAAEYARCHSALCTPYQIQVSCVCTKHMN